MVKIFQGDYQTIERDVNNWIEVYDPADCRLKTIDVRHGAQHHRASDLYLRFEIGNTESPVQDEQVEQGE